MQHIGADDVARIRTVKPELPQDVKLASCSRDARYTFVLLITQADDEGLIPGAHRQLLGLLYPHDDDVTAARLLEWVEELVAIGAIRWRATLDSAPVIELTNWSKHQRVDNKGRSSLKPVLAELAAVRGESPQVAEVRRLEGDQGEGPRTMDLGVGAGGAAAAPVIVKVTPHENQLRELCGDEHWPEVKLFLDERPPRHREDWAKEGLKMIAGSGLNLPEDLAQGWRDARLSEDPPKSMIGARGFVDTARRARLRATLEAGAQTTAGQSLDDWAKRTAAKEKASA
jgi:hypothetical protein